MSFLSELREVGGAKVLSFSRYTFRLKCPGCRGEFTFSDSSARRAVAENRDDVKCPTCRKTSTKPKRPPTEFYLRRSGGGEKGKARGAL